MTSAGGAVANIVVYGSYLLLLVKRVRNTNDNGTLRFYTNIASLRDATPAYREAL